MKIAFRVDASQEIGFGHVMRCHTLAQALCSRGDEIHFFCRELTGNLIDWLRANGSNAHALAAPESLDYLVQYEEDSALSHSGWLGVSWQQDRDETLHAIEKVGGPFDWLIVDHYALDKRWESSLRQVVKRIMVIDDLDDRSHDCDLFLNQNLGAKVPKDLVPDNSRRLLGPLYALLRPEFLEQRLRGCSKDTDQVRLLVFMGGADPGNETGKVLEAIANLERRDTQVDCIVGSANPHKDKIKAACAQLEMVTYHENISDMHAFMVKADLMIGTGGSTSWERCSLGLPAILVNIARNQDAISRELAKAGACINLGNAETVTVKMLENSILNLLSHPLELAAMSQAAAVLTDARGTERVMAALKGKLRISIVSDKASWINDKLQSLIDEWVGAGHRVTLCHDVRKLPEGDCAFFLSCGQLAGPDILRRNTHNLVVHESALPRGRGWSPLTWQVLEGCNRIPVTLFEAAEKVDSGIVYLTEIIRLEGFELVDGLREAQWVATHRLCRAFVTSYPEVIATRRKQTGEASYYARRKPEDSRLEIDRTLRDQFNLLRVVDNESYPAFFEFGGHRFILKVYRAE